MVGTAVGRRDDSQRVIGPKEGLSDRGRGVCLEPCQSTRNPANGDVPSPGDGEYERQPSDVFDRSRCEEPWDEESGGVLSRSPVGCRGSFQLSASPSGTPSDNLICGLKERESKETVGEAARSRGRCE